MLTLTPEHQTLLTLASVAASVGALIFAGIAAYFAVQEFRRKVGARARGFFRIQSSASCTEKFVSEVLIENTKDKPLIIFGVYLRLSHNVKIALEEFHESDPMIVPPYGVVRRAYDPIVGYSFNLRPLTLERLLDWDNKYAHLILYTSERKIRVRKWYPPMNAGAEWLRNHMLVTASIDRGRIGGKGFGGKTKYVVELAKNGEVFQSLEISDHEHEYKWFRDIGGSKDSLESVSSLEYLFHQARADGKLAAEEVLVHDFQKLVTSKFNWRTGEPIPLSPSGWFKTHVIGLLLTRIRNWYEGRKNRRLMKGRRNQS